MSVKSVLHRLANELNRPGLHEEIERDDSADDEYDSDGNRIERDKDGNPVTGVQHYDSKGQPVGGRYNSDGTPVNPDEGTTDVPVVAKVNKEDTTDGNA
jgi:hypothetical protein